MGYAFLINQLLCEHVDTDFSVAHDLHQSISDNVGSVAFLKIVACGSGSAVHLPAVLDKIISMSGTDRPNVLYIGTAVFDRDDRYVAGTSSFREYGCEVARLTVSEPDTVPPHEEMLHLVLDWADVIMCSGGNTLYSMLRWKAVGLDLLLKEAVVRGKVLCGGSAGAGCWFHSMQTDSLKPEACKHSEEVMATLSPEELADWRYAKISCMGFIPAFCVPHFDTTGTSKVSRRDCAKLMAMEQPGIPALCIDEKAALVVEGNSSMVISGDGLATCHTLLRDQTGEVISMPLSTGTVGFYDERTDIGSMLFYGQCCVDLQPVLANGILMGERIVRTGIVAVA